jgi:hypothetical protein
MFATNPPLGGGIRVYPDDLCKLIDDALEALGPTVEYTAHNGGSPDRALALMISAQTAWTSIGWPVRITGPSRRVRTHTHGSVGGLGRKTPLFKVYSISQYVNTSITY